MKWEQSTFKKIFLLSCPWKNYYYEQFKHIGNRSNEVKSIWGQHRKHLNRSETFYSLTLTIFACFSFIFEIAIWLHHFSFSFPLSTPPYTILFSLSYQVTFHKLLLYACICIYIFIPERNLIRMYNVTYMYVLDADYLIFNNKFVCPWRRLLFSLSILCCL